MNTPSEPLSVVVIALMKGVTDGEADPALWQSLLELQGRVRDYVAVLGLEVVLDEAERVAFLRQRPPREGEPELPRLVPRRQLSYPVSLLLALLRRKLAELDAASGETRLIVSRDELVELVRVFLSEGTNEARAVDRIDAHIQKVVELGFLRRLRGKDDQYEVRRILKSFVDAQWLDDFSRRLAEYAASSGESES